MADMNTVKKLVMDVMTSNGKVYVEDKYTPFCRLKTLAASSIDFFAYCWCDNEDYWDVYYYVVESVYNEFKKNNISVPYSQLEVRNRTDVVKMPFDKTSLPTRVEKKVTAKPNKGYLLEKQNRFFYHEPCPGNHCNGN